MEHSSQIEIGTDYVLIQVTMFIGIDSDVVDEDFNSDVVYHDLAFTDFGNGVKVKIEEVVTTFVLAKVVELVEMVRSVDDDKITVLVRKQNIPFPVIWDIMEHGNEIIRIDIYVSRITRVGKEYEETDQIVKKHVEVGNNDDQVND